MPAGKYDISLMAMAGYLARGTTREPEKWTIWPRVGMPEDCAALFLFLASDASEFITGQVISPNGGGLIIENMIGVN